MKLDEFVAQVQQRVYLDSPEAAMNAIGATLETLGERLPWEEAHGLAEQLPPELGRYLDQAMGPQEFDLDDFFTRVSFREGVDLAEATPHALAVMEVLKEAVSPGMIGKLRHRLPEEYHSLFAGVGRGHVPGGRR